MVKTKKKSKTKFTFKTTFLPNGDNLNKNYSCQLVSQRCQYKTGLRQCKHRVIFGQNLCWQHTRKQLHVAIFKSRIPGAGNGLFAYDETKRLNGVPVFLPNDFICNYNGKRLSPNNLKKRYGDYTAPYVVLTADDHSYADAACYRGIGSLPNHTTKLGERNAYIYYDVPSGKTVIKAFKVLKHGDEILLDYNSSADEAARITTSLAADYNLLEDLLPGPPGANYKKWRITLLDENNNKVHKVVPFAYLNEAAKQNAYINYPNRVPSTYVKPPNLDIYELDNPNIISGTYPAPKGKPFHGGGEKKRTRKRLV